MSTTGWNHFKVSPYPHTPFLTKVMRTLYGFNLPQKLSLDIEIAVDQLAVKEAPFITVTPKTHKSKGKASLFTNSFVLSQNMPTVLNRANNYRQYLICLIPMNS